MAAGKPCPQLQLFLHKGASEPEFEPMLIKPEPIGDDFKPKIELKKEEIAFERGIEETMSLEIEANPVQPLQLKIKQEIFFDVKNKVKKEDTKFEPMLIKPEPFDDDSKPKIELKSENIAFEKGIEETLNLEINSNPVPESTDNIQPKTMPKIIQRMALNNVISPNENDEQFRYKVQSTKNFRIPKLSVKVQEKLQSTGSSHDRKKRFKCAMCSEKFSQRNDLNQRFHCDKCSAEEKKRLSKFKESNGEEGLTKAELKGFQGLTKAELMDNTKVKEEGLKKKEGKSRDF